MILLSFSDLKRSISCLAPEWFRPIYILQVIWREAGWGTIIYLAAIASIDPQLYEAARMDGAGRIRQMWHITLPAIRSVIIVLLILKIGAVLELGFEHVYLLLNSMNRDVAEIIDTYVYTAGSKTRAVQLQRCYRIVQIVYWTCSGYASESNWQEDGRRRRLLRLRVI